MQRMAVRLACAALLLPLCAAAADLYIPGTVLDPKLRAAKYMIDDRQYFSAIGELRSLDRKGDASRMPSEYQWQLAEAYLSFGIRDRAEEIYRSLAEHATDELVLGRARLRLAEFEYQRGYWAESRATLLRMRERLPQALIEDWQDMLARVLMADGRYGDAVEVLTDLNNAKRQSPFTRYNLAVALINEGRVQQGQTVMDRIGRMSPKDVLELALRDRANLSLGWNFLQNRQAATAKPILSRVRVVGPFSNRALLGLGWAELSPDGAKAERVELGDEEPDASPFTTFSTLGVLLRPGFLENDAFKRAGLRNFRLKKVKPEEEAALKKALVPWVELISRDPMDPAVQEAWLAIPYSLDKLGAHTQALSFYEKAVGVLETARKRQDAAMASIKAGIMVEGIVRRDIDSEAGWEWELKDLPDAPETYFLQTLLAQHEFQEALKNLRDTRLLARNLDAWKARLDQVQQGYQTDDRPLPDVKEQFARAKEDWQEPWKGLPVQLRTDDQLAAPGTYDAPLANPPFPPRALTASASPKGFNGPVERAAKLQARVGNLRALVAAAGGEQDKLLKDVAIKELEGQRKQIEKYLVEARFALARLYDRQKRGEMGDEPVEQADEKK
ncbi:MAG TPA: hypothetical protein VM074_12335 [Solimonas sp.]|nr:hypothetical protein [Solimonas sp.]